MNHTAQPPHVSTNIWACFRARLAHYLGQQREILVVANQPRQPFPIPSMSGVAGLPYEFPNDAFEHGGFIDFTEGRSRYVFQYSFIHALPIQAWESLVWKICAKPYITGAGWRDVGYVEFDSRVYLDAHPILPLVDGELLLRLMVISIENDCAVRLASRVEAPIGPGGAASVWNVETLEARSATTDGENLLLKLGERYIPKRSCAIATCRAWLPASGPDICDIHMLG